MLLLSLMTMAGAQRAMAWGGFGHSCAAYIAEQHLTPEVKAKCRYYLKHTLPFYASWMDQWRSVPEFRSVNTPHSIAALPDGANLDWSGKPNGGAMGHLKNALDELGDGKYKSLPDSVVRQRIINMVHYLPDMHCPVHVRFPKSDYSHYRYKIYRKGKVFAYHKFWDGSPGYKRKGWTVAKYAEEIDHVKPKQVKKWQKGSLDVWARDIIKQAHRCYQITPAGTDISGFKQEDVDEVHRLADEMILKGAYRLAYTLNTIFAE